MKKSVEALNSDFHQEVELFSDRIIRPEKEGRMELGAYYHIVISGPGGSGKSTIIKHLETLGAISLPTVTTRKRRDTDGSDRINVSEAEFLERVEQGDFLFWHQTNGSLQGFPKDNVGVLESQVPSVIDKSLQSVIKLRENLPDKVQKRIAFIYMFRPSILDAFEAQLKRGDSKPKEIVGRLHEEVEEMSYLKELPDQLFVANTDLDATLRWSESLGSLQRPK